MATRKKHTPEQVVKLATADRRPTCDKDTTWTALAPDVALTVLAYGPSPLYGPPSVRSFSSPGRQTIRSPRRTIGYARILSQVRFKSFANGQEGPGTTRFPGPLVIGMGDTAGCVRPY